MKKLVFAVLLSCAAVAAAHAQQQITRFAVVDLARVYAAFFLESRAMRDWEERFASFQTEIDRMSQEIRAMQSALQTARAGGDQLQVLRLQEDLRVRQEFLREFHAVNSADLEAQRRALAQSDEFLMDIYSEIRSAAETEGFAMVLDLNATPGILWHTPTVDITERVIRNLHNRPR